MPLNCNTPDAAGYVGQDTCFNSNVGGIAAVYYLDGFNSRAIASIPDDLKLSALPATVTKAARYETKSATSLFSDTNTNDTTNMTSQWEQSATLFIPSTADTVYADAYNLTRKNTWVVVEFNSGDFRLMGAKNGCFTTAVATTNGELSAGTSITLTITATELAATLLLDATAQAALLDLAD